VCSLCLLSNKFFFLSETLAQLYALPREQRGIRGEGKTIDTLLVTVEDDGRLECSSLAKPDGRREARKHSSAHQKHVVALTRADTLKKIAVPSCTT